MSCSLGHRRRVQINHQSLTRALGRPVDRDESIHVLGGVNDKDHPLGLGEVIDERKLGVDL